MSYYQQLYSKQNYYQRLNQVIDYIEAHLDQVFTLEELSAIANFSPYHFHRLFSAFMEETLGVFIKRLRLEKAASLLLRNPKDSITQVALRCGFSGSAAFSRAFREHFHCNPSYFRYQNLLANNNFLPSIRKNSQIHSNNRQIDRKNWQAKPMASYYINEQIINERRLNMKVKAKKITVKAMPELNVVYCRHRGAYHKIGQAFDRILKWAAARDLLQFPKTQILGVYHDDPQITEEDKLRSSACITVPVGTKVDSEVGTMIVSGGKYVVGSFEIDQDQFTDAWNVIMRDWLPESGYQGDDRMCYEIYYNDAKNHPHHKWILDICLPIKPL